MTEIKPEWVEAAILAALNAGRVNVGLEPAGSLVGFIGAEGWRAEMRTALAAVLPDIIQQAKAEAWGEGHAAGCTDPYAKYGECDCGPNPYRAAQIEAGR